LRKKNERKEPKEEEIYIQERFYFNSKYQLPTIPLRLRRVLKEKCNIKINPKTTGIMWIVTKKGDKTKLILEIFEEKSILGI